MHLPDQLIGSHLQDFKKMYFKLVPIESNFGIVQNSAESADAKLKLASAVNCRWQCEQNA